MTADSNRPKNGHDEVRWVHLHPWHSCEAVCGFSMHPAVLMAISDFEIDMVSESSSVNCEFEFCVYGIYIYKISRKIHKSVLYLDVKVN